MCSRAGRREFCGVEGVFRHFQIVEDEAGLTIEPAHGGGDAVGLGAYDADGEALQAGGVLGAVSGSYAAAVLIPAAVEDVVGGLGAVADGAQDVGLAGAVLILVDGVAQGLAVDGQDLVVGAVGIVPALQGAVELGGVDAHEHLARFRMALAAQPPAPQPPHTYCHTAW